MLHQTELLRLRRSRYAADIPDTLYMVEDKPRTMGVDVLAAAIPGRECLINNAIYNIY